MENGRSERIEEDLLGTVALPESALIGINTYRSLQNFSVTGRTLGQSRPLVCALAQVKKAAALANAEAGALDQASASAIAAACDELAAGQHADHLVCDILEGSGGTSVNMNVNEVIANIALVKLGSRPGDYARVHPNDHINLSQSTNDVVPSAVRLAIYASSNACVEALTVLADALDERSHAFADVLRLGRTCLQDAQPMTLGQAFGGYAAVVRRHAEHVQTLRMPLLTLSLGGTAIGTGFGVRPGYRPAVFRHLADITAEPVRPADDPFDAAQNADDCARLSAELKIAANSLWKIGNDLILLSSGPEGGLGEVRLPSIQAGSSIMPGKINPVLPMTVCQAALAINGNDLAVSLAAQQGMLDLNHYELLIADRLLDSLGMLTGTADGFARRCISGIEPDAARSLEHLRASAALATILIPKLGYAQVSALVEGARDKGRSFIEQALAEGHLTEDNIHAALLAAATVPGAEPAPPSPPPTASGAPPGRTEASSRAAAGPSALRGNHQS